MFEIRELQYFVAVAERLNVSSAAKAVNLSQPALSRQIQSLERKLGVALFERIGKRLTLTAEGGELLGSASELLDRAQDLANRAYGLEQGHTGTLRIAASPQTTAWLLSPVMAKFRKIHPNVSLLVSEGNNDELVELIAHGNVHLSIASLAVNNVLVGQRLFSAQLLAILPAGHPMTGAKSLSIEDLSRDSMLVMRRGFLTRHLFEQVCAAHGVRPKILLESDSTHTLGALARDGHGVAIVSSSAQDTKEIHSAIPIRSASCRTSADVSAIWNPNRYRPASLNAFMTLLVAHSRSRIEGADGAKGRPARRTSDGGKPRRRSAPRSGTPSRSDAG
jgi:DNA-binding transcriptional LysR family regulator